MKIRKYLFAMAGGLLCLPLVVQPLSAGPSQLLNKARQAINVTATSDSTGIIPHTAFVQIKPDGSIALIPTKDFVVINQIFATFYAGGTPPPDGPVTLRFGLFWSLPGTISGGSVGFQDIVDPGIVIGDANFTVQVVDASNAVIPGILTARGVGFLANPF